MNITDLKSHFYKRFCSVPKKLTAIKAGFPVSLLGYIHSDHIGAIGVALSPEIKMLASKTEDLAITITSTRTDKRRRYSITQPNGRDKISEFLLRTRTYPICGGEILADCSIPPSFDPHIPYTAAAVLSVLSISDIKAPATQTLVELSADRNEYNAYATVYNHSYGYATYTSHHEISSLPFPVSMHKIMLIDTSQKKSMISASRIEQVYSSIRHIYPHISSFKDLSKNMLYNRSLELDNASISLALHLINEASLLDEGKRALKSVNLSSFANIVNSSFASQKQVLPDNDTRVFLCNILLELDGVVCARVDECGVIAIINDDSCDFVAKEARAAFLNEFGFEPVICITNPNGLH